MSEQKGVCDTLERPHIQDPACENWRPLRDWETDGPALERRLAQIGVEMEELAGKWSAERDAKCDLCAKEWELGRHGCHFEPGASEEGAQGRCKAWPLSRRIQELRALAQQQGAK